MRHCFSTYDVNGTLRDVTTRIQDVPKEAFDDNGFVVISDNLTTRKPPLRCNTLNMLHNVYDDLCRDLQWRDAAKRKADDEALKHKFKAWNPLAEEDGFHVITAMAPALDTKVYDSGNAGHQACANLTLGELKLEKDHINPSHYQGYVMQLQWLETMQYLPHFRDKKCFQAAVELQIRKYLDRSGGKDDELQEAEKALWYHKFLVAYMKAGGPIRVKDIDAILRGEPVEMNHTAS